MIDGFEDAFRVWRRNPPVRTTSVNTEVNSEKAILLVIGMLQGYSVAFAGDSLRLR